MYERPPEMGKAARGRSRAYARTTLQANTDGNQPKVAKRKSLGNSASEQRSQPLGNQEDTPVIKSRRMRKSCQRTQAEINRKQTTNKSP